MILKWWILFFFCLSISSKLCDPDNKKRMEIISRYIEANKQNLTKDDIQMIKFIAGNCFPIVIIPGFYGNKFQLQITNCTELKLYHEEIARQCGFMNACTDGMESTFWLSEHYERNDNSTCFGELIKLNILERKSEELLTNKFYEGEYKGFRLTYFGDTPLTKDKKECGFGASTNLLDKYFYFGIKSLFGLRNMKSHLLSLGYQIGLNLFSVPYDWRRLANDDVNMKMIHKTVELAFNLTQKQVIIIGHSYGVIVGLNYLYSLPAKEKTEKIQRFVAITPPFLGTNKIIKVFVLGYEEFNVKIQMLFNLLSLFISIENQKVIVNKTPSAFEVFPRTFWKLFQNTTWMQAVIKRTHVENKISECVRNYFNTTVLEASTFLLKSDIDLPYGGNVKHSFASENEDKEIQSQCIDQIINEHKTDLREFKEMFPYFPDLVNGCGNKKTNDATCTNLKKCKISIWDSFCRINFWIPYEEPMIRIVDGDEKKEYYLLEKENIIDLLSRYGKGKIDNETVNYFLSSLNPLLNELQHPGVPVTIYYLSSSSTPITFSVSQNPKLITDNNEFVIHKLGKDVIQYGGGDGTLPTSSSLLPALKWAFEDPDMKNPIHFVDYCSNPNREDNEMNLSLHQYMTIGCECTSPSDSCSHSSLIGDENVILHVTKYIVKNCTNIESNWQSAIDLVERGLNNIEKMYCRNLDDK